MGIVVIDNGGSWCTGGQPTTVEVEKMTQGANTQTVRYDELDTGEFQVIIKKMKETPGVSILIVNTFPEPLGGTDV